MTDTTGGRLRERFLQGMSLSAATVNVVTTAGAAGRAGVTVSAMTSVSADGDAPTLLICVHHLSAAAEVIIQNGCFCTNILRDDQIYISDVFSGREQTADRDKFSCADWLPMASGALRAVDPLAAFDCRVKSSERVGTHYVFIGEVGEIFTARAGSPLIYANRAYGSPTRIHRPPPADKRPAHYRIGAFHTFGPYLLPRLLRKLQDEIGAFELELHEGDQRYLSELLRSGTIDFAFLYDFNLDADVTVHKIADLTPYVLLAGDDALTAQRQIAVADLLAKPLVLLDTQPSRDYFLSLFDGVGEPTVAYRTTSFETLRGMVAHGMGYSLLVTKPASATSYDGKSLTIRPLSGSPPVSTLALCYRGDSAADPDTARFLTLCRRQFGVGA